MDDKIQQLINWVNGSDNIVFFGGAGVSTESGIPDFRSVDGLYNQKYKYPPEEIISRSFYESNIEEFYRFYWDRMIYRNAEPNITHKVLADLEKVGKLKAVVTQNIDGLHQKAGSKTVYELHGSTLRNYCTRCGRKFTLDEAYKLACEDRSDFFKNPDGTYDPGVPKCPDCGGRIKPDVVLYEESLDEDCISNAVEAIERADMLIIGGTSLVVYPAAGFVRYYQGNKMVLINKSHTQMDASADLVINDSLGKVFTEIKNNCLVS